MQHKRQEMESEPFPRDRGYLKRRKIGLSGKDRGNYPVKLLSPTDSGFGDCSEPELEQDDKLLDGPSSDSGLIDSLTDGTELLEEHRQRDSYRGSTDSENLDSLSDGANGKELLEEHREHDSEALPGVFDGTDTTEPLEEHEEHDSENACSESTEPNYLSDISDSTEVSETLENKQHDSEYSYRESTDSESLLGVFDGTNATELLEQNGEHDSEYSYRESTDSNDTLSAVSDETDEAAELQEHEKFSSKYSESESLESKRINEIELLKKLLCVDTSLNEYLWQPRFNDDSSYESNARVTEETEQQQLELAIRNSLIENVPDKREVKRKGRRSRRVLSEVNEGNSSGTRLSMEDFIFSQFNVTGAIGTLPPEMLYESSSEEFSREGHHFIASLLQSMTVTPKGEPKFDDEVRNLVLDMKEKMRGDKYQQIHWLAACLLQLYADKHKQLDRVLQFYKRTARESDKLNDEMSEMAVQYLSSKESSLFQEIMGYLDALQVGVFLSQSEVLKASFKALKVLANSIKGCYEGRLAYGNSEDAYLNLSKVISFFCPLFVNVCDTAVHTVKKCKEFYRVRNYILSRMRKN